MTNTIDAIDWSIGNGANAVELDVMFTAAGDPWRFVHSPNGEACDCTCVCAAGDCATTNPNHICAILEKTDQRGISGCSAYTDAATLLRYAARRNELAMVYIDSKVSGSMGASLLRRAATKLMIMVEKELFGNGFRGKLMVGSSLFATFPYIEVISKLATQSSYSARIMFGMDLMKNSIVKTLKQMNTLANKNLAWGTGLTSCVASPITWETYKLTLINRVRNNIVMTYAWSIDKETELVHAINHFDGIITNYPAKLSDLLRRMSVPLARPDGAIVSARGGPYIESSAAYTCDCDWYTGGCVVSKPAPRGFACSCAYKGGWTCSGDVITCYDNKDPNCVNPSKSHGSCLQGRGNCDGYKDKTCNCDYSPGGCKIKQPAQPGYACQCAYAGAWTCHGYTVNCADPNHPKCKSPDTTAQACAQGKGDCGAYSSCDCEYRKGGCHVTKAAPANHACQCWYKGGWTCAGQVTLCINPDSPHCVRPDTFLQSCVQGKGDCGAYSDHCECTYHKGGCQITKAPLKGTACKCTYPFLWSCASKQVACRSFQHKYCQKPDKSEGTCLYGGGECHGYP